MAWLGEGRKLTQTGRIGLADARHLVELLGTGDKIDPEIYGRVHKTNSSEELPYLTRIVEWMKAARLVRVTGTRLVPVKKNAALADRPLDLVLAMLEAYPRLGTSLFPRNTWRQSVVGDEFTVIGPELLTTLLVSQGPCPMDDLKEVAFDMIAVRYMLDGQVYPACIAGEGACPPEDSGGAYGFEELKEVLAGPPSTERTEMQEWAGDNYDPTHFDLAAANAAAAAV